MKNALSITIFPVILLCPLRMGRNSGPLAVVGVLQRVFPGIVDAMSGERPGHRNGGHVPGHGHGEPRLLSRLAHLLRPHSHEAADTVDTAMESSAEGMRALWISLAGLGITAGVQAVVVALSGSAGLLSDTVHNGADAMTAAPLAIAFILGRRAPTRRYTYGYGRAEDLAGVAIVLLIALSSLVTLSTAATRLVHPHRVSDLAAVAGAALAGFAGNELVARYRIRVGTRISSAALVADGLHARADGFTSLAVLAGAGGAALGQDWADPVAGLLIALAIAMMLRRAAREVFRRLMDAVDPALVDTARATLEAVPGVCGGGQVRLRWIGHRLRAECEVTVDAASTIVQAHRVAAEAEHALLHAIPRLTAVLVHPDPGPEDGVDHHRVLAGHR
jgi:cation diffusion facilitator family transporter